MNEFRGIFFLFAAVSKRAREAAKKGKDRSRRIPDVDFFRINSSGMGAGSFAIRRTR